MASVDVIGKAQIAGGILQQIVGVEPAYDYRENYVRVYYPPDSLRVAQANLAALATSPPGDLRIEWAPVITPYVIKKVLPIAAGLLIAGFMIGRRF